MTTQYAEEQGFKKKYLAPLIVLMLCAVSLTGAAYAYSTTVNGNGDIQGDYYSIDMYDTDGNVIKQNIKFGTVGGDFDVQTEKTVGNAYTAKTVNAAGENADIELVYKLKTEVQSSQKEACKITGTITYTKQAGTGSFYDKWNDDATKLTCKILISAEDDDSKYVEATDFTAQTETVYFVKIVVTLPAISGPLSSAEPTTVPTELAFNGTNCLAISLKATNA